MAFLLKKSTLEALTAGARPPRIRGGGGMRVRVMPNGDVVIYPPGGWSDPLTFASDAGRVVSSADYGTGPGEELP